MKYIQIYNFRRCRNQVKLKTQNLQNLKTLYTYSLFKKNPIGQHIVRSLCVYEAIIKMGTLKHLTNTLKIVKITKQIETPSQFFFQGSP